MGYNNVSLLFRFLIKFIVKIFGMLLTVHHLFSMIPFFGHKVQL